MPTLLDISCTISAPSGTLDLNQQGVYKLEKSAFDAQQVQQRRTSAKNPFVEGEFVVHAVKENVLETLSVFVYASDALTLKNRVYALTDALEQIQYTLAFRQGNVTETWTCQPADYAIRTQQEFRFALMAQVTAQIPRRPTAVFS